MLGVLAATSSVYFLAAFHIKTKCGWAAKMADLYLCRQILASLWARVTL